jgi:transketolase
VPTVKPVDVDELCLALAGRQTVAVVEEHNVIGGLGSLLAESLTSVCGGARLVRIGIQDRWGESASDADLLDRFGLSARRVADVIADVVHAGHHPSERLPCRQFS